MSTQTISTLLLLALTCSALADPPPSTPEYQLSGPYTHENLTVYFLHGKEQFAGRKVLTLAEALEAKKVIVHETKNVQQLAIENVSAEEVFAQAGDIVKGGQQDRVIAQDMLIAPKSGKIPIGSFCVEQGRWAARGSENVHSFSRSDNNLIYNSLKLAARGDRDQRKVWQEVVKTQKRLSQSLNAPVDDSRSRSSLQLTLENKKVQETVDSYVKNLQPCLAREKEVPIGYAVIINGKIVGADVYANGDLFKRLWPKLLQGSASEAVSEKKEGLKILPVQAEQIQHFLQQAKTGKRTEREGQPGFKEVRVETAGEVLFETQGKENQYLRRSYLKK